MLSTILIRCPIEGSEISQILLEFPELEVIDFSADKPLIQLGIERLSRIEIFYGPRLTSEELVLLPHLHWIHSPTPFLDGIAPEATSLESNYIVTTTREENVDNVGEFALAAALSYIKNLWNWEKASFDSRLNTEELREGMKDVQHCLFFQIGLGLIGSDIAKRARQTGFRVLGAQEPTSFHPDCEKIFSLKELDQVLPTADIVSIAMPRDHRYESPFGERELSLMKEDSALLVFGAGSYLDVKALFEIALKKRFRGILLDAHFSPPLKTRKDLPMIPHLIISEESSPYPLSREHPGFHHFLYNLRQFLHGNFSDMRNVYNR